MITFPIVFYDYIFTSQNSEKLLKKLKIPLRYLDVQNIFLISMFITLALVAIRKSLNID